MEDKKIPCGMCHAPCDTNQQGLSLCKNCQDLLQNTAILSCFNCGNTIVVKKLDGLQDRLEHVKEICAYTFTTYDTIDVYVTEHCVLCQ